MTGAIECRYSGRDFIVEEMTLLRALIAADPQPTVNGGAKMPHARRPGGPVAAAQKCATYGPLSVLARGGGCTAWSSMRRFGWRLSMRG